MGFEIDTDLEPTDDELVDYLNEGSSLDEVRGLVAKGLKAKTESEKIWYMERIADIFDVPHYGLGVAGKS